MSNIWSYIVVADKGLAPCIENNLLSICVCKPSIRRNAAKGDIIIGWASKQKIIKLVETLKQPHPVFIAEVTDIQKFSEYFDVKDKNQLRNDKIYNKQLDHFCKDRPDLKLAHHSQEEQNKDLAGGNYKSKAKLEKIKARASYQRCLLSENFYFFGTERQLQKEPQNLFRDFWESPLNNRLERGHKKINLNYGGYYEKFLNFLNNKPIQGEINHFQPLDGESEHRLRLEAFHNV